MATLYQQLQKAKTLSETNIKNDLFKFIRSIEKEILEKQKQRIFDKSEDIHGEALGFYSKATEFITNGAKKAGEPFSGYDTGDLFDKMYIQEVAGVLRFLSKSPHLADILKSDNWLSEDFLGLSDEDLKAIIETRLLPFLLKNIREKLDV